MHSPKGQLITQGHYYEFSSVFFYTDRTGLLWTNRRVNLEYGSNAPGAPPVFLDDSQLRALWLEPARSYLFAFDSLLPQLQHLLGSDQIHVVATSGGKSLLTNQPFDRAADAGSANAESPEFSALSGASNSNSSGVLASSQQTGVSLSPLLAIPHRTNLASLSLAFNK
jgi:hypothetical protein